LPLGKIMAASSKNDMKSKWTKYRFFLIKEGGSYGTQYALKG
jgi:hypothetical protein